MCSRSRLVTTARMGESLRKERSLSSASATRYCVVPSGRWSRARPRAAHHDRRVEAAGGQHAGHHRSGGGLAVHAGDGDAVLEAHQLGQHLGALNDGNLAGAGLDAPRDLWRSTAELVTTTVAPATLAASWPS
jgi:hypothetical protein